MRATSNTLTVRLCQVHSFRIRLFEGRVANSLEARSQGPFGVFARVCRTVGSTSWAIAANASSGTLQDAVWTALYAHYTEQHHEATETNRDWHFKISSKIRVSMSPLHSTGLHTHPPAPFCVHWVSSILCPSFSRHKWKGKDRDTAMHLTVFRPGCSERCLAVSRLHLASTQVQCLQVVVAYPHVSQRLVLVM